MTFAIVAKTSAQKITGFLVSDEQVVLQASPLILHTVPAGRTQKIHLLGGVVAWGGAGRTLQFRVAGSKIIEFNDAGNTPPFYLELGIFVLTGGQDLRVTTTNSGTEGGTALYTAAILQDTPS